MEQLQTQKLCKLLFLFLESATNWFNYPFLTDQSKSKHFQLMMVFPKEV